MNIHMHRFTKWEFHRMFPWLLLAFLALLLVVCTATLLLVYDGTANASDAIVAAPVCSPAP